MDFNKLLQNNKKILNLYKINYKIQGFIFYINYFKF